MGNPDRSHFSDDAAQVLLVGDAPHLVFEDTEFSGQEDSPAAFWLSGLVVRMLFAAVGLGYPLTVNVVTVMVVFRR